MEDYEKHGAFMCKDGLAKLRGMKNTCKKKVCFFSTDHDFLIETLSSLSQANDCFDVKCSIDKREGAYCGFCTFTNESSVGDVWARYESHPKLWVAIQDDIFCESYRSLIRTY